MIRGSFATGWWFGHYCRVRVKDFSELTRPSDAALAFGFMRSLSPDDQARSIQSMVAKADLCDEVPEDLAACFERIRSLFALGLLCYEAFTAAEDLAWLMFEQAVQERFVTFYRGEIPLISKSGEQTLTVPNFGKVIDAFRRGGPYGKGGWTIKLRATGMPLKLTGPFVGGFGQLQQWARQEGLFSGQRNRQLELMQRRLRNWSAHPRRHLNMPSSVARTIHDLAEVINQLWGHSTPGGRLYPAPMIRSLKVIGWPTGPSDSTFREMSPEALLKQKAEQDEDWSYAIVLAVPGDDSLQDFDTLYDITPFPADLVWGPGARADARQWLATHEGITDTITYMDRVFAVRRTPQGRVYLPQRPAVTLGLPADRRDGVWHLVRADFPQAAFHHVKHGGGVAVCASGDPLERCPVEDLYEGPWGGIEGCLRELGVEAVPTERTRVRVPPWRPYPPEIGDD